MNAGEIVGLIGAIGIGIWILCVARRDAEAEKSLLASVNRALPTPPSPLPVKRRHELDSYVWNWVTPRELGWYKTVIRDVYSGELNTIRWRWWDGECWSRGVDAHSAPFIDLDYVQRVADQKYETYAVNAWHDNGSGHGLIIWSNDSSIIENKGIS